MDRFTVDCRKCGDEVSFTVFDVPELDEHIQEKVSEAERAAESETEESFEEFIDPGVLVDGSRLFYELSVAIRRGDRAEAEHQLDRLAEELGVKAIEQVQQGRFSLVARRAA